MGETQMNFKYNFLFASFVLSHPNCAYCTPPNLPAPWEVRAHRKTDIIEDLDGHIYYVSEDYKLRRILGLQNTSPFSKKVRPRIGNSGKELVIASKNRLVYWNSSFDTAAVTESCGGQLISFQHLKESRWIGGTNSSLWLFDIASGRVTKFADYPKYMRRPYLATSDSGNVYVVGLPVGMSCYDVHGGKQWTLPPRGGGGMTPAGPPHPLDNEMVIGVWRNGIIEKVNDAVDVVWTTDLGEKGLVADAGCIAEERLFLATHLDANQMGSVVSVNIGDGKTIWETPIWSGAMVGPIIDRDHGRLVVVFKDTSVVAFNLDGKVTHVFNKIGCISKPYIARNGAMYYINKCGKLEELQL